MIPTHYEGAYFEVYMCKIIFPYGSFFQFIFAPQKPFNAQLHKKTHRILFVMRVFMLLSKNYSIFSLLGY